jgi:hypothetical protein
MELALSSFILVRVRPPAANIVNTRAPALALRELRLLKSLNNKTTNLLNDYMTYFSPSTNCAIICEETSPKEILFKI